MPEHAVSIQGLTKSFPANGAGEVRALLDFDLDAEAGEVVVIVGPNGAGKTTLLNLVGGDIPPDRGSIFLAGQDGRTDITRLPRWQRARYVARVHQNPKDGTVANLTVLENLHLASMAGRNPSPLRFGVDKREREAYLSRLAAVGIEDKLHSRVADLSQGQRQLLAVELALLQHPKVLLLDEHTASLDMANAARCLEATEALCHSTRTTALMVTHNLADALRYGDRLVVLRDGRAVANVAGDAKAQIDVARLFELCGYATPHA